jgi:hypothetical protein
MKREGTREARADHGALSGWVGAGLSGRQLVLLVVVLVLVLLVLVLVLVLVVVLLLLAVVVWHQGHGRGATEAAGGERTVHHQRGGAGLGEERSGRWCARVSPQRIA